MDFSGTKHSKKCNPTHMNCVRTSLFKSSEKLSQTCRHTAQLNLCSFENLHCHSTWTCTSKNKPVCQNPMNMFFHPWIGLKITADPCSGELGPPVKHRLWTTAFSFNRVHCLSDYKHDLGLKQLFKLFVINRLIK